MRAFELVLALERGWSLSTLLPLPSPPPPLPAPQSSHALPSAGLWEDRQQRVLVRWDAAGLSIAPRIDEKGLDERPFGLGLAELKALVPRPKPSQQLRVALWAR
jgi:hypothetical protein